MKKLATAMKINDNDKITHAEMIVDFETRLRLASSEITLNGNPAKLLGLDRKYAVVMPLDNNLRSFEWSWETVKRIVENKQGKFKA